ncbi:MAG: hypothetical protein JWO38_6093 [Gemmataceae bacterium]|nr:hypothetical protein [Gemmataceae bacterium]
MVRSLSVTTGWVAGALVVTASLFPSTSAEELPPHPARDRHLQVLYVEGTPRWEYRQHRSLLDRRDPEKGQLFAHNVVLLGADPEYPTQDQRALADIPLGAELDHFDLVILGDVDPEDRRIAGARTRDLARYVRDGGRLLVIAGPLHVPHDLKGTALQDVLPIDLGDRPVGKKDAEWKTGYRPVVTEAGRKHPAFQTEPKEVARARVWNALPEMYWWAGGHKAKAGAEVLLTHPTVPADEGPLPLVVWKKVEKGRCGFVGFDETWRWRRNTDGDRQYRIFWTTLWRSLAAG